jgi:hypothetical protein
LFYRHGSFSLLCLDLLDPMDRLFGWNRGKKAWIAAGVHHGVGWM